MIRAAVLAAMLCALPVRADAPPVYGQVLCDTLEGSGRVRLFDRASGEYVITLLIECGRRV